jgi:hypothetical protein
MSSRKGLKLVREGEFVAEVEVEFIEDEVGWSPCLSVEDADKLDRVRECLRRSAPQDALKFAKVYKLHPITRVAG